MSDLIHDVFDPEALIDEVIASDFDPSVFSEVRDHDMPQAKNVFEWLTGKDFCAIPSVFPKQIEVLANFLEDYCAYCSSTSWLRNIPVDIPLIEIQDRAVWLEKGICPRCGKTRPEMIADPSTPFCGPLELDGCAGMRSGKSVTTAMLASYQLHRFLSLPDPAAFYQLMPGQHLYAIFVATTAYQAQETLWQLFVDRIKASPWFKSYHKLLASEAKRIGNEFYKVRDTFLWYGHKGLSWTYTGADIRTIRGRTRFFCAIDEIGWFDEEINSGKVRYNADETHQALEKALRTIRSRAAYLNKQGIVDVPNGLFANISSPSSIKDKIMRLVREAANDKSKYAWHYATWEFNPMESEEELRRTEGGNPMTFARDYAAIPPLANMQFISSQDIVEQSLGDKPPLISIKTVIEADDLGYQYIRANLSAVKGDKQTPRLLAVDSGEKFNSFAITLARLDAHDRYIVEAVLEIAPQQDRGHTVSVNFNWIFEDLLRPLCQLFRIEYVAFDRWQSTDHIHRLRADKIDAEQITLVWNDFIDFRARLFDHKILLPKMEKSFKDIESNYDEAIRNNPVTHLVLQMMTVREVGRKVAKPIGGEDDIWRSVVLGHRIIRDEDLHDRFICNSVSVRQGGNRALGIALSRSSYVARQQSSNIGLIRRGGGNAY